MDLKSPRLRAFINGDDRHPREIVEVMGKSAPEDGTEQSETVDSWTDKPVVFNPTVGGLEFPEEGAILFCQKLKEDD